LQRVFVPFFFSKKSWPQKAQKTQKNAWAKQEAIAATVARR
jgi:hypothetical protein